MDIKEKTAIVTGGKSGIGFATVQHLLRKSAKVCEYQNKMFNI